MEFRPLKANEIDCRVAQVKENGCSLLLYKDARCDMRILDETVGAENWQREHYECKGNLFCKVGIRCGHGIKFKEDEMQGETFSWVWKSDCGVESYTEKEKGEASDSFKRACFNWGIGRELYTAPFIWIEECNIKDTGRKDTKGKPVFTTYDKFEIEKIAVENGEITGLAIINTTKKKRVFLWQKGVNK